MKRNLLVSLLLLFSIVVLKAQSPNLDSIWIVNNYHKMETMIPMRDGVKLFTAIFIPNDMSEKHPILMMRTPYSCAPYGKDSFLTDWNYQRKIYYKENYIIVRQDVRGRFMSEGDYEDVRPKQLTPSGSPFGGEQHSNRKKEEVVSKGSPPKGEFEGVAIDEATDTYDAIDWLVKNVPNNNGNVGVTGISYPGFYSTMAALSNHPALKAVSPQAPVTDWFMGDDVHHNGAYFVMDDFDFDRRFGIARPHPLMKYPSPPDLHSDDNYDFFLNAGTVKDITHKLLGDSLHFWNEVMNHPNYDDWWQARNARKYLENVKPAMLTVGGLFDAEDIYGTWNVYKTIEKRSPATNNKIIMGPWAHNRWAVDGMDRLGNVYFGSNTSAYYFNEMEVPFFNYYLKGKGDGNKLAEATIFITGENKWHQFNEWPPKGVTMLPVYLKGKGEKQVMLKGSDKEAELLTSNVPFLDYAPPFDEKSFDEYISDPAKPVPYTEDVHRKRTREYMTDDQRFAARRPDVLVYESAPLEFDMTLTGPITADLFVSISTTDADFVVKLIDVFPDNFSYPDSANIHYPMGGYQMLVRGEPMRGRYRNSFEKPEAFKSDEITEVKYEMPDVAHNFKKGHRIMIQIQSSWFPLVDRNPQQFVDIYHCDEKDFVKSTIRVYHDKTHPSSVTLPLLGQ